MTPREQIPLEKWAALLAHHQHFGPGNEGEVLSRLGVSDDAFLAASLEWSGELGRAAGQGKSEIVASFAAALKQTKERLARNKPSIESLGAIAPKQEWRVDATSADAVALSEDDVLPFGEQPSAPFRAALASGAAGLPAADVGETGVVPALLVDVNETLPFGLPAVDDQAAGAATKLSLEQYASLCAELAVYPQRGDSIRQRYGFRNSEEQVKEDRAWSTQLAGDAARTREWQALVRHYQTWLLRNPR